MIIQNLFLKIKVNLFEKKNNCRNFDKKIKFPKKKGDVYDKMVNELKLKNEVYK